MGGLVGWLVAPEGGDAAAGRVVAYDPAGTIDASFSTASSSAALP